MDGGAQAASNERRPGWPQRVSGERAWAPRPTLDVGEPRSKPSPKYQPTGTARFAPNSITRLRALPVMAEQPASQVSPRRQRSLALPMPAGCGPAERPAVTPVRGHKGCEGQDGRATLKLVPALKPCKATVDDRFGSCSNATQTRC